MALRHPDIFTSCITMGGAFDITQFLDGYYDEDCYLLCPPHFLPSLGDAVVSRSQFRAQQVGARHRRARHLPRAEPSRRPALLARQGHPAQPARLGNDSQHDWPEWRQMAAAYLAVMQR